MADPIEPSIANGPGGSPSGGRLGQMFGGRRAKGQTSAASAGLKFDIGGLQEFKRELTSVRDEIGKLRTSFRDMASSTKDWTKELVKLNAELAKIRGAKGTAGGVSGGVPGGMHTFTGASGSGSDTGLGSMMKSFRGSTTGTEATGAEAVAGSAGASAIPVALIAQAVGAAVTKGLDAMNNRFASGMAVGGATDMWLARTGLSTGTSSVQQARGFARSMPLMGTAPGVAQALNMFSSQGGVFGGQGIAGQIGAADVRSAQQLQGLLPGTSATEAASRVTALQSNVEGQRKGQLFFGSAAWMQPKGGGSRSAFQYYQGILKVLQARRVGTKNGQPYTREELEAARAPGSTINYNLSLLGWNDQQVSDFFDYAIGQAAFDPTGQKLFEGTPDQNKAIGRGDSVARNQQLNQTAEGKKDMNFYANQADSMISQLGTDRAMIAIQQSMDNHLNDIYNVLAKVPSPLKGAVSKLGGVAAGAGAGALAGAFLAPETLGLSIPAAALIGGAVGLFASDVMDGGIGDAGLSQLNPDLRSRMSAMMAANPNLQVNSGFRDARTQQRLWESGKSNIAPPGKSRHGRGQAADIGPASQLGWLNANAKKFGLDTGKSFGEPWHVQVAGTMIGDVGSEADALNAFRQSSAAATADSLDTLAQRYYAKNRGKSTPSGGTTPPSSGSGAAPAAGAPGYSLVNGKVPITDAVKLLYAAGFRGEDLVDMAAIPSRESGYDPTAHGVGPVDDSWGMWQVNFLGNLAKQRDPWLQKIAGTTDHSAMTDPWVSAQMAYLVYQSSGNSLHPWISDGNPLNHVDPNALTQARDAAKSLNYIGDIGAMGGGAASNSYASLNQPLNVTNHFAIAVNGSNGVNVDALTKQIAAKLEPQIRRMQMTRR